MTVGHCAMCDLIYDVINYCVWRWCIR